MISRGHADNLTNIINVVLLPSTENFNIWSSLSQEVIQTEHIIIFKSVWRNAWKPENVTHCPEGSHREDGSMVLSCESLLGGKFLDGKEADI